MPQPPSLPSERGCWVIDRTRTWPQERVNRRTLAEGTHGRVFTVMSWRARASPRRGQPRRWQRCPQARAPSWPPSACDRFHPTPPHRPSQKVRHRSQKVRHRSDPDRRSSHVYDVHGRPDSTTYMAARSTVRERLPEPGGRGFGAGRTRTRLLAGVGALAARLRKCGFRGTRTYGQGKAGERARERGACADRTGWGAASARSGP